MIKFAPLGATAFDVPRNSIWLIGHMASSHRLSKTRVHHYSGGEERKIRCYLSISLIAWTSIASSA